MHSLSPSYLRSLSFVAEDMATLSALGESRGRQDLYGNRAIERLETLRQAAIIESSESSNRIEGVFAPRERIEALVLRPTEPRDRSEQEIAGYRDVLRLVHESHASIPASVNTILKLHQMLYAYHAGQGGRFKMQDNEIVERDSDAAVLRVRFRAVSAVGTPEAVAHMVERYVAAVEAPAAVPALVAIPLLVFDFLCIHPFADGNGRVARLLALLLLYHHGYAVCRYVSLERIIEESKVSYYETLESSSGGWHEGEHDVLPWLRYFWGTLQRAYAELEERMQLAEGRTMTKTDLIVSAVRRRTADFRRSDLMRELPGVSADLIRKVLRRLRDEGEIEAIGSGRAAAWRKTQRPSS